MWTGSEEISEVKVPSGFTKVVDVSVSSDDTSTLLPWAAAAIRADTTSGLTDTRCTATGVVAGCAMAGAGRMACTLAIAMLVAARKVVMTHNRRISGS